MRVCLFDIDGTLINSGGAGGAAMLAAFAEEFGASDFRHDIQAAGRTDRAIALDVFKAFGLTMDEPSYDRYLEAYLRHLPIQLRQRSGVVLPGIAESLSALSQAPEMALGLLTGNLQRGAYLKLEHFELHQYFDFGGFGDRHLSRNEVARDAFRTIKTRFGSDLDPDDIWVIGDTPADIECGRAINARTLAVSTGIYSYDELAACDPDVLLEDLTDLKRLLKLLEI